jgi:hypothetical protein
MTKNYLIPLTLRGKVYTDLEAVMKRILLFLPPKVTLDVQSSGIGI